jgi:flavin-dependent dehydrogenase
MGETVTADVVIVGAGPGGSATATHLARAGLSVQLLEKSTFPREKVCGDGLTPRATRELIKLGIDTTAEACWLRNKGLRIYGGRTEPPFEMPWPEPTTSRPTGWSGPRRLRRPPSPGMRSPPGHAPPGRQRDGSGDRRADRPHRQRHHEDGSTVVAADGNSSRSPGHGSAEAQRPRWASPSAPPLAAHDDDWLESWLELWDGEPNRSNLLPGYGWIFGMGDGTCNVGLGMLNTSSAFGKTDYKDLLKRWLDHTPAEWGFRDENRVGDVRGAALPMGFNRQPAYSRGLMLVGDSGGMVNPFNGEGIAYAMEAGRYAADHIAEAHYRGHGSASAERALAAYVTTLQARGAATTASAVSS